MVLIAGAGERHPVLSSGACFVSGSTMHHGECLFPYPFSKCCLYAVWPRQFTPQITQILADMIPEFHIIFLPRTMRIFTIIIWLNYPQLETTPRRLTRMSRVTAGDH